MKENNRLTRPSPFSLQLTQSHDVFNAELFRVGGQGTTGVCGSQPVRA